MVENRTLGQPLSPETKLQQLSEKDYGAMVAEVFERPANFMKREIEVASVDMTVTGAAGGIGSAIVRRFLSEGAKVCAVDNRTDALNQLVVDLSSPDALLAIEADVSSEESCYSLSAKIEQTWGTVDILVNNAGNFPATPFENMMQHLSQVRRLTSMVATTLSSVEHRPD
ncbi:MAG: SDR family NAD(P)-dependent oxidoreductase [Nostoc sp.]|uniref:SDR family NAD(P)-dependent oxidoreductase n=1 Tax=Nostoc sp. TaxID=1180 RepID=UPI002FF87199